MSKISETLFQLRYARQKIERIEEKLQKSSVLSPDKLRVKIDDVIGILYVTKIVYVTEAKQER